jgi:hypothetical protein
MNIFTSDKAPYVVGLLATILGWHVSQLAEEVRSTRAVAYSVAFDTDDRTITATIENVSKTKSLVEAEFALACGSGKSCLLLQPAPPQQKARRYGFVRVAPPNAPSATQFTVNDPREISIKTTLAAGGRLEFGGTLERDAPIPSFFFKPDAQKPLDIYLYEAGSPIGVVVRNYFTIILISFIVLLAILMAIVIGRFPLRVGRWLSAVDGKAFKAYKRLKRRP